MIDLDSLEFLAKAATLEPWYLKSSLNPQIVLELIAEVRRLRASVSKDGEAVGAMMDLAEVIESRNEEISSLKQKLELAVEALSWYANWDWTDKYVQAVPKRAREALKKIEGEK